MPLLDLLRTLNAASLYWTGEPMDLKAALAVVEMTEEDDDKP